MVYRSMAVLPLFLVVSLYASEPDITYEPIATEPNGWWDRPDDELRDMYLDGTSYLSMKMAMDTAPEFVQNIVLHLKDHKEYNKPGWRYSWLFGPAGGGKSTLCKAVAAYLGWDIVIKTPADFQTKGRGEAARLFNKLVDRIVKSGSETLMVIEESDGMMNNAKDNRNDNAETSRAMWTKGDTLKGKHKFFMLYNSNTIDLIPKPLKSRFKARICHIEMPKDPAFRQKIAYDVMYCDGIHPAIPEVIVKNVISQTLVAFPKWQTRDYQELGFEWSRRMTNFMREHKEKDNINELLEKNLQDIFNKTLATLLENENYLNYEHVELTETERHDLEQLQNVVNQTLTATENRFVFPGSALFFEVMGWKKPVVASMNDGLTDDQRRLVAEGKTPFQFMTIPSTIEKNKTHTLVVPRNK